MLWRRKDSRIPSYTWLLKDWKNLPKAEKIIWIPKLSRNLYVPRAWMPGSLQSQETPDHTDCYWQWCPVTVLPLSLVRPAARVLCCSQLARLWAFCLPALISEATRLIHGTITSDCLVITVRCIKSNLLIKCLCNKVCIDFREAIKSVIAYLKYRKKNRLAIPTECHSHTTSTPVCSLGQIGTNWLPSSKNPWGSDNLRSILWCVCFRVNNRNTALRTSRRCGIKPTA